MGLLDPTAKDVMSLDDVMLRELVRQLCRLELKAHGHSTAGLIASGPQDAGDGGVDVRVVADSHTTGGYLPRACVGFQVKATPMSVAAIRREMRKDGTLRPSIVKLAQDGGAYIIASGRDNITDSGHKARIEAMAKAVADLPNPSRLHLDFYDAGRLADWAAEHPGVALWLLAAAGRPIDGWSVLASWSAPSEPLDAEFLVDDHARMLAGDNDDALSIVTGLERMRGRLGIERTSMRLLGQSGMGKTRLAQALFDDRVGTGALAGSEVLYVDAGEAGVTSPVVIARQLIDSDLSAVVVVDNCPTELHASLTALVRSPTARFSLLTIDFDVGTDFPEQTEVVRLDRAGDDLIKRLLERRAPHLGYADRERITEFSEGNTRIALALSRTTKTSGSLAGLEDTALINRLFLKGRREGDPTLHQVARTAALAFAFYVEGDPDPGELGVLASLADLSEGRFFDKLGELLDRGLAQQRGRQRAILPQALAAHLAKDAVKRIRKQTLARAYLEAPPRLRQSLIRRLGLLHDSDAAKALADDLLGAHGIFAHIGRDDADAVQGLAHLAPLAPRRVLDMLSTHVARYGAAEIIVYTNQAARLLTQLTIALCYDAETFDDAARLLAKLVLAQDEKVMVEKLKPRFAQLFQLIRSGTHASVEQRFTYLDRLLSSGDADERRLGLEGLQAALRTQFNNSGSPVAFGARPRDSGLWPKTEQEIDDWYGLAISRCLSTASGPDGASVKTLLAQAYPGLMRRASIQADVVETMVAVADSGFWARGWFAACNLLNRTKYDARTALMTSCEERLRPRNLDERFEAFLRHDLWDWHDPQSDTSESSWEVAKEQARRVGVDAVTSTAPRDDLIRIALSDAQVRGFEFGEGLAAGAPDLRATWDQTLAIARTVPADTLQAWPIAGFLKEARRSRPDIAGPWLEASLDDPLLASLLPQIEVESGDVDPAGLERIIRVVSDGRARDQAVSFLTRLRSATALSDERFAVLIEAVLDLGQTRTALSLLDDKKPKSEEEPWPACLVAAGQRLLCQIELTEDDDLRDHQVAALSARVLSVPNGEVAARNLLDRIKQRLRADDDFWLNGLPQTLAIIAREHPRLILDLLVSPADGDLAFKLEHMLKDSDDDDGHGHNVLSGMPVPLLMDWVAEDPANRAGILARLVPYFQSGAGSAFEWTAVALALLEVEGQEAAVTDVMEHRFFSGSWSGPHSQRFTRRLPMLAALRNHRSPAIRAWSNDFHDGLVKMLAKDAEAERGVEQKFE